MATATATAKYRLESTSGKFRRLDASPTAPRVVKDILRVGKWVVDGESAEWAVEPKTLSAIVDNFRRFRANGNRCPLIFDHDGGSEGRIGDVVDLTVDGETLYATCEIHNAKHLSAFGAKPGDLTQHEVSVEVSEPFVDGQGNEYPICLTHLAVCLNPVVPGQGPFKRLSLRGKKTMAKKQLATEETEGADSFSVDEVKEMLAKAGYSVPDIATTKEAVMAAFLAMAGEAPEESVPEAPPEVTDAMVASAQPQQLRVWFKRENQRRLSLQKTIDADKEAREADAKKTFEAELAALVDGGKVHLSHKDELLANGKELKWRLSLLAPFKTAAPTVPTSGTVRKLGIATGQTDAEALAEKQKRAAAAFGVRRPGQQAGQKVG